MTQPPVNDPEPRPPLEPPGAAAPYGVPPPPLPAWPGQSGVPSQLHAEPSAYYPHPGGYGPGYAHAPQPAKSSGLYLAAAILNWVTLAIIVAATCGFGLIAAAWFIPMTIFIHKGTTDGRKHTALAVCTLLFCNLISGILMLVDEGNRVD